MEMTSVHESKHQKFSEGGDRRPKGKNQVVSETKFTRSSTVSKFRLDLQSFEGI